MEGAAEIVGKRLLPGAADEPRSSGSFPASSSIMTQSRRPAVVSVFGVNPRRIGGVEMFARELSRQLDEAGFTSVLSFQWPLAEIVREFLQAPNVKIEVTPGILRAYGAGSAELMDLVRRYRPSTVHLHF